MGNERYQQQEFYMHTANALAPQYIYEEEQQVVTERRVQKQKNVGLSRSVAKATAMFVLAIFVVSQYVYIQGLGYGITQQEAELNSIVTANEKLKKEYSALGELAMVEEYAINTLGMVKADATMSYVATAEVEAPMVTDEVAEDGAFKSIVNGVLGVLRFN